MGKNSRHQSLIWEKIFSKQPEENIPVVIFPRTLQGVGSRNSIRTVKGRFIQPLKLIPHKYGEKYRGVEGKKKKKKKRRQGEGR